MSQPRDLTQGPILQELTALAIPIMLTMFVQMMYNLTDMFWIGHLGSGPVAAVGTAGFFLWFCNAIVMAPKIGVEVGVAQAIGRKNPTDQRLYAVNGLRIAFFLSLIFGGVLYFKAYDLMAFFQLGLSPNGYDATFHGAAYLRIVTFGAVFQFLNPTFSGIFNGLGNSKTPFYYNSIGLILNALLDPLLIYGMGPFPRMEITGAAIATAFAQMIVFIIFFFRFYGKRSPLRFGSFVGKLSKQHSLWLLKVGSPAALQSAIFSMLAMIVARILSKWGPIPIAVQRVGSQIEAISYMTAGGFSTALSTFTGQNYGARKLDRIAKGYNAALLIMTMIGIGASLLLILLPEFIFRIFIQEADAVRLGIDYLRILGYSQLFMCVEILTGGAFNGLGRSFIPAIVSVALNALRIPLAILLPTVAMLGLNGIWWAISGTSIIKGTVLVLWFYLFFRSFVHSQKAQKTPSPGAMITPQGD